MNETNNTDTLYNSFISKLESLYGKFDFNRKGFESTSNSKIARDLCYSDSQFSRLVNNTASEGEFKRAVRNVDRLLTEKKLEKNQSNTGKKPGFLSKYSYLLLSLIALIAIVVALILYWKKAPSVEKELSSSRYEMLQWSFENQYIQPYVKLKQLPADCNYPCYKYQGKWVLKEEYKIPFFRERNGFHWVAKDATMYARCMQERDDDGNLFEGYEYQHHEIWYDKREWPIDSFLLAGSQTQLKPDYSSSHFEEDENFVKLAHVHTFFRNEFSIDSLFVNRSGQAVGRDLEFVSEEALQKIGSASFVEDLKNEVNSIAQNRLMDFSKPINCSPADVPNANFHLINENDELRYKCQFTTGRFLVDYEKVFVLEDQYINNMCR